MTSDSSEAMTEHPRSAPRTLAVNQPSKQARCSTTSISGPRLASTIPKRVTSFRSTRATAATGRDLHRVPAGRAASARRGEPSRLSGFLSGTTMFDPETGEPRRLAELARRRTLLEGTLCSDQEP